MLRKLYVDEQRTLSQVARHLGCSDDRARAGLLAAGVALRPPRHPRGRPPPPALHKEQLRELYVGRGLSAAEIAAQVGGGTSRVTAALNRYGIPLRPASRRRVPRLDVDAATLTDLYVSLRLDDTEIGARFGVPAWRVKDRRLQLGVARPVVPPPHPGPPPAPPAEELRRLYLDEGLPSERIARHYRAAAPVVRRWLREAGIPVRPRTTREHRRRLDIDTVRDLYQERGWTSAEVAALLGTHVNQVLRTLHDAGVPVRRGGPRPRRRPERPPLSLLASLYVDPDIAAALREHNVTPRDLPGSIADRFPTPVPLTEPLLQTLYNDLGLSTRHIELLTGQPFEQILDALHGASIPVRHLAGRSPWLTRQYE